MALDFTLLTEEQIWGDKKGSGQLDVMKKYGTAVAATDLAVLLGASTIGEFYRTLEGDLTYYCLTASACDQYVRRIDDLGGYGRASSDERTTAARPVLPPSETKKIKPSATKIGINGVEIVEYGEYPQTLPDIKTRAELEKLFQSQQLQTTGKTYTFDSTDLYDYKTPFKPEVHPEYLFEGERYIRVIGRPSDNQSCLPEAEIPVDGRPYWLRVEPIEWLKDPSGYWISKKSLFAGINFNKGGYWGDFENTFMKSYLNDFFAKEIEPPEFVADMKRAKAIEGLKNRLAEASDLDKAMADTKPARTPERTELAARMHRSRRERDVIRAAADKAREAGDDKLFEAIAEMAGPAMARAQVVERKFHERQAARRVARAKSGRG